MYPRGGGLCGPCALPRFQQSDEEKKTGKGQLGMRVLGCDCCIGMLWLFGANILSILPLLNDNVVSFEFNSHLTSVTLAL